MKITIANKKLHGLLHDKDSLVTEGRKMSDSIDKLDKKLEDSKAKQRKFTNECNPKELIEKGDKLRDKINIDIKELEKIGEEVQKAKLAAIPKPLKDEYESMKKEKETMERDRNKIALKVQKIKDRAIPLIQKEVKPHLGEYDDIETAQLKGEQIVVTTFNHLDQWVEKFTANKRK